MVSILQVCPLPIRVSACALVFLAFGAFGPALPSAAETDADEQVLIDRAKEPFKGDLPEIRKRRFLRVLVSYSKTNFFSDKGVLRGYEYEQLNQYKEFLNQGVKTRAEQTQLLFIPLPFDRLLEALRQGRGDIAAAGFTITEDRQKIVNFTDPYLPSISEVVVTRKTLEGLKTLEDLAGREVMVRAGSSYLTHLKKLNERFLGEGKKAIRVIEADASLGTEDILELVNAGVVNITVADHHIAEAWAEVLPDIVVRKALVLNSGGRIAWAVRQNNPKLRASLNAFVKKNKKGSLLGNILFKRYYQKADWIKNPISPAERKKLDSLIGHFQQYGNHFGYDWLALAAQGYQESGLDQRKKSRSGAIGVMQILPSTAADKSVNIRNIHQAENNIHAGTKYLSFLHQTYFNSPEIEPSAQLDFAWASYNAGPAKINRMRARAVKRGFDPNRWFGNVEQVTASVMGREPVDYVANINKYYIAYKLAYEDLIKKEKVLDSLRGSQRNTAKSTDRVRPASNSPAPSQPPGFKEKISLKAATKKQRIQYHTVRSGDTLYSVGRRYGLSVKELMRVNNLPEGGTIHPGDRLRVSR